MKAMVLVPAAFAAFMALNISTASSQQACQQEYTACMSSCATRPSKSMQDSCFQSCEGKNNFCAEKVYGKRPMNSAPSNVAEQSQAKDALAKKQKGPSPEAAQAEAKEPAADDRAPQQDRQAPPQQAPARR